MRNIVFLGGAAWLAAALAVSSCALEGGHGSDGPPEWVKVGETDSLAVYLSAAPPEKVSGHLLARLKVFYLTPHHAPSNNPSTVRIWEVEYDCANHRSAMRAVYTLSRPETGTLDRIVYPSAVWHADSESASGQLIAQRVCALGDTAKRT